MPLLSLTKIQKKVKTITLKDILSNDPRVCQTLNGNLNALYTGVNLHM